MNDFEITKLAENGFFENHQLHAKIEDTHISWIILSKRFAFKVKKPVKLSFLDFSSKMRRKNFCEKEVRLNRRLSSIYIDVLPICNFYNSWYIGFGRGEVKEYAIRMKRLRSSKKMDSMLNVQQVKKEHVISLAKTVALFHRKATIVNVPFEITISRALFNDILTIRRFVHQRIGQTYSKIITQASRWSDQFLKNHALHFQNRISSGFKRDVHGDMHSGNIFLYKKPVIFDCIEFNDSYRQIDVIDEIAFLCMDFEVHGRRDFSNLFLKEYIQHFPCFYTREDKSLFAYFKCYRANVRAKVNAINAQQSHDEQATYQYLQAVKAHLQLLKSYLAVHE
jgi:aminoglycoside phosphotransferase family enzyme